MKKQINIRFIVLLTMIAFIGFWRVFTHGEGAIANFTPIGAMAIFGGAYFGSNWKAFLFPIAILFISDLAMMNIYYSEYNDGFLYSAWYWSYFAFAIMVLVGRLIKKVNVKSVVLASVSAALAHWIIVDFGVWVLGGIDVTTGLPFTKDVAGLIKCYTLAIPFLQNMIMGNLIFGALLFGGFEFSKAKFPALRLAS